MQQMVFMTRERAAQCLNSRGIPGTENTLAYMAARGKGPAYSIINGRACYREGDIDSWIQAQAERNRHEN